MSASTPTRTTPTARPRRGVRSRVLRLAVALAGLAAFAPAPAHAVGDLRVAIRVANAVFPSVPQRCGAVAIEIGPLSSYNAGASAESYFRLCKVRFAPETLLKATNGQLCSLTIHEWGHLAGLSHSSDPKNIMSPTVPHHPACGPSDDALDARAAQIDELTSRREAIADKLYELRAALRQAKRAHRRARGARRAALARRVTRLKKRITKLKAQYRALS